MDINFETTDHLMQDAVAQRIFPGAVLLVADQGRVVFHSAYGMADLFSRRPATQDTLFDLASLTKPLVTTLVVMQLVRQGEMVLDHPCRHYWPSFQGLGKEKITIRHLLSHSSGLPAWRPYYLRLRHYPSVRRMALLQQWVLEEPLGTAPGLRAEYSDIGFMVLQWVIEHIMQQTLDVAYKNLILAPLQLQGLLFVDLSNKTPQAPQYPFAATEFCSWRNRLIVGEVHDDNAYVMGGIAGHAGLFGTSTAVFTVLQILLSAEQGNFSHPLFSQSLLRTFFQCQPEGTWALGFDTPSQGGSSAGRYFSAQSVGHLGYTGTSFWVDRKEGVLVVLLTNRVHPSRSDQRIRQFRPVIHDCVRSAIGH